MYEAYENKMNGEHSNNMGDDHVHEGPMRSDEQMENFQEEWE